MTVERLYLDQYGLLVYWLTSLTHDRDRAEDFAAEAFVLAFEHWDQLVDKTKAKNWLYTIAYNAFKRSLRRQKPTESLDNPDQDWAEELRDPLDFIEELQKHQAAGRAAEMIRAMRPKLRQALARHLAGQPCQGTWGSRLHQAKRQLARAFAEAA